MMAQNLRAAEFVALRLNQKALHCPAGISPSANPAPLLVGLLNETPDGAVFTLAIVKACADDAPITDAAVVSTPKAILAPPATSEAIHNTGESKVNDPWLLWIKIQR